MKRSIFCLGLTTAVGLTGLATSAMAQDWSDDFESYSNGQVLYHVGGWSGWDDLESVAGSCTTARAHAGTKSMLCEGADDAIQTFEGLTSGSGTMSAWVYIPISQFVADTFYIVQNEYNHGGPYQWCIELCFDFEGDSGGGPGTVADDFRTETNFPPIQFDTWVEVRCEVDIDADTITCYYGGTEVSTGQLFIRGGAAEIKNLDLYTTGTSTYWDDCAVTGLGGGGGYTCTISGTCPGQVNLAWDGAPPSTQQGIVFARNTGSFVVPNGPCMGTQLGLGTNQLQLYNTIGTGANGSGNVNANANQGACGGFVQLVAIGSPCQTSTVAQVP
jgi:hypothetical protein